MNILRNIGVPLFYIGDCIYTQKKNVIGKYDISTDDYYDLCDISIAAYQKYLIRLRGLQRIFRMEARAIACYKQKYIFFAICRKIYQFDMECNQLSIIAVIEDGNAMPLHMLVDDNLFHGRVSLIYGDYGMLRKKAVCIHCIDIETREDKVIYQFQKGEISHIHAVIRDMESGQYFVLTGDNENESGIYIANSRFSNVRKLVHGSTEYRTCNLIVESKNNYIYAMDSTFQQNYICNLLNENAIWQIKKMYMTNGPCIYSVRAGKDIFLSTTVEPDPNSQFIFKLLGNRTAGSIQRHTVTIVRGNVEDGFQELMSVEKDWLPMGLYGFGNARFVTKYNGDGVLIYFMGVKNLDGRIVVID